jgi:uncharacterized protein YhaN
MALRGLTIEGYGHFHGLSLDDVAPGLTVLAGPNEAGKSTLVSFMRFVLFGHTARLVADRTQALAGGRLGGRLTLQGPRGAVAIERYEGRSGGVIVRADGQPPLSGDEAVRAALGGVDPALYRAVYSFALEDLTDLSGLGEAGLRERLFMGALAGAGRDVSRALAQLDTRWSALYKQTRGRSAHGDTQERLRAAQRALDEARQAALGQAHALETIAALDARHEAARAAESAALSLARRWQALVDAAGPHAELRLAEALVAELPPGRAVDTTTLEAARQGTLTLAELQARADAHVRRIQTAEAELQGRPPASPFGPHAETLDALDRALRALSRPEAERADAAAAARRRVTDGLATLGLPDVAALEALDLTLPAVAALRSAADAARRQTAHEARLAALQSTRTARAAALEARLRDAAERPRDPIAQAAYPEVAGLVQARVAIAREEARATALRPALQQVETQLAEAVAALGGPLPGPHDPGEAAAFVAAVHAWTAERAGREAHVTQVEALLEARTRALAALEASASQAGRSPDAADVDDPGALEHTVSTLDRLPALLDAAAEAERHRDDARQAAARATAALGGDFAASPEAVTRADVTAAARETLRGAARAATAAETSAEAARRTAASASAVFAEQYGPPDSTPPDLAALDRREEALDRADAQVRARDEAALRAAGAGPGAHPQARTLLILLGAVLVAVGATIGALSSWAAGAPVLILGLLVLQIAARGLPSVTQPPAGAPPATDVGALAAAAAAALAALALPASAGPGELAAARAELRRLRRRAEAFAGVHAEQSAAERAQTAARAATATWAQILARHAWPGDLRPDTFEPTLAELVQVRTHLDAAHQADERARDLHTRLAPLRATAAETARTLALPAPDAPEAARLLLERLRALAETRRTARRRAVDDAQRLNTVREERAQLVREVDDARAALAAVLERGTGLRDRADALGVPAAVPIEAAPAFLEAAERTRTLAARREETADALNRAETAVADWQARVFSLARERLGADTETAETAETADAALQAAERRCKAAAELAARADEADALVRAAEAELRAADEACGEAAAEARADADAPSRWRAALEAARAPQAVTPDTWEAFLEDARRTLADARTAAELDLALAHDRQRRAETLVSAGALARSVGAPPPADLEGAATFVRHGLAALATDRAHAEESGRLRAALADLRRTHADLETERTACRAAQTALLAAYDVDTVAGLETLAAQAAAYEGARTEEAHARRARTLALGAFAGSADLIALLDAPDPGAWTTAADAAARDAAEARKAAESALVAATAARTQFDAANTTRDVAELAAQVTAAQADLEQIRVEMAGVALARLLLQRTLDRFREAHQPAIFRTAGAYLAAATGGAYVAIETGARENDLVIVDRAGGRREPKHLSRGTAELLYLVLRLGLVEQIAGPDALLPLVLDDVLVNLDVERAEGMTRLLAEVSARHQTLLLTCRPETVELLLRHVPGARCIELPRFAGRPHPVPAATAALGATEAGGTPTEVLTAVVGVLQSMGESLSRAELQARLPQYAEALVTRALDDGRDQGSITTEGKAKGTRYRAT